MSFFIPWKSVKGSLNYLNQRSLDLRATNMTHCRAIQQLFCFRTVRISRQSYFHDLEGNYSNQGFMLHVALQTRCWHRSKLQQLLSHHLLVNWKVIIGRQHAHFTLLLPLKIVRYAPFPHSGFTFRSPWSCAQQNTFHRSLTHPGHWRCPRRFTDVFGFEKVLNFEVKCVM